MGTAPGDVAKALLDALPSLDHKKLLEEARRTFGIVIIGDEQAAPALLQFLREPGQVPADSKVALWRQVEGATPPVPLGKTELAIVVPATEQYLKHARDAFGGVPVLPIILDDQPAPAEVRDPVRLRTLEAEQVRKHLVPRIVDRFWERRLALGRAVPATRDRIAWLLMQRSVRDVKVLLGSVAGAGRGRSGVPTPATAQVLVHQAALIVAIGAVYGADVEDKAALIRRVTPSLTPSLVLDVAEARISALVEQLAGEKNTRQKLYGTAAAVLTRPALTASSTLLVGLAARRVFREREARENVFKRAADTARDAGQRAVRGMGRGAGSVVEVAATRLRRRESEPAAAGTAEEVAGTLSVEVEPAPEDQAS